MAVIDELIIRNGTTATPADSYDGEMIDEIVLDGQSFHFAKPKGVTGEGEIIADNAVDESIIALEIDGNTTQNSCSGDNLFDQEILLQDNNFTLAEYNGEECIKVVSTRYPNNLCTLAVPIPAGTKFTFSYELMHPETPGGYSIYFRYADGTNLNIDYWQDTENPVTSFKKRSKTHMATQDIIGIYFAFYSRTEWRPYYFRNFMVSKIENLFDISNIYGATNRIGTTANATYGTVENGVIHAKYSLNQGAVKWLNSSFIIKEAGTYELSCEVLLEDAVVTPRICWNFINASNGDALVASGVRASSNLTKGSWLTTTLPTITVPDTMIGNTVYLMLTSEGGGGQNTDIPCYIRNVHLSVNSTNSPSYEPYVGGTYSPNPGTQVKYKCNLATGGTSVYSMEFIDNHIVASDYINLPTHCTSMRFYAEEATSSFPEGASVGIFTEENGFDTLYSNGEYTTIDLVVNKVKLFIYSPDITASNASTYWSSLRSYIYMRCEYTRCENAYPQAIENVNYRTLPDEYQQVEFIESTGTQAIELDIRPTYFSKLDTTMQFTTNYAGTTGTYLSGTSLDYSRLSIGYASSVSKSNFTILIGGSNLDSGVPFDTNKHRFILRPCGNYTVDDVNFGASRNTRFLGAFNMIIFASKGYDDALRQYTSMRLYEYKLYNDGALLRDLVPCYRKSDEEIGLYDLVSRKFYTNIGTGTFLKGADVQTEKMKAVVHGENLYDISKIKGCANGSVTNPNATHPQFGEISDNVMQLKWGLYANSTFWTGVNIPITRGGKYYISCEFMCESTNTNYARLNARLRNFTKDEWSALLMIADDNVRDVWQTKTFNGVTIPDSWIGDEVYLSLQVSGTSAQYSNIPAYAKNIMISYGDPKPYQPYFEPVEITIPQSVEGKLGNINNVTVSLKFAGLSSPNNSYGDAEVRDELVVKPPQVLYVKNIAEYQVTGEEEVLGYDITQYGVHAGFKTTGDAPHPNNSSLSLCNCAGNSGKSDESWFDLWPGYPDGVSLSFNFPGYSSIEEMVMTMKQKYSEGNPITILYPKVLPDTYDISKTDLGRQLLALATHKGVNHLKITGNIEPSKTDLTYWRQIIPNE